MPKYAVAGCAYRHPAKDDPGRYHAPPVEYEDLREWHLHAIAPHMVGLPIKINHYMDGVLHDHSTGASITPETQTGLAGARAVGKVTRAWVNKQNKGLYWTGEIEFTEHEKFLDWLYTSGYIAHCSLHHTVTDAFRSHKVRLVELSLCHRGKRPGTTIHGRSDIAAYMRNNGYEEQTRSVMASTGQPPAAVAAESPVAAPVAAPVVEAAPVATFTGPPPTEDEIGGFFESLSDDKMRVGLFILNQANSVKQQAERLQQEVERTKKELHESDLAQRRVFQSAYSQFGTPEVMNPIAVMASIGVEMTPDQSRELNKKLTEQTIAMHESAGKRLSTTTAAVSRQNIPGMSQFLAGLGNAGVKIPQQQPQQQHQAPQTGTMFTPPPPVNHGSVQASNEGGGDQKRIRLSGSARAQGAAAFKSLITGQFQIPSEQF